MVVCSYGPVFKMQNPCVLYVECRLRLWDVESGFLNSNLGSATLSFMDQLHNLNASISPSLKWE
jgi:hypothetical protein